MAVGRLVPRSVAVYDWLLPQLLMLAVPASEQRSTVSERRGCISFRPE